MKYCQAFIFVLSLQPFWHVGPLCDVNGNDERWSERAFYPFYFFLKQCNERNEMAMRRTCWYDAARSIQKYSAESQNSNIVRQSLPCLRMLFVLILLSWIDDRAHVLCAEIEVDEKYQVDKWLLIVDDELRMKPIAWHCSRKMWNVDNKSH